MSKACPGAVTQIGSLPPGDSTARKCCGTCVARPDPARVLPVDRHSEGQPFAPDARMNGILADSVADAIARSNLFASRNPLNRSLLPTDQKLAGLDSTLPGIRMNQDGGVTVWFAPQAPTGEEKNWVQTMPGQGYNVAERLFGPQGPWFNQIWRAGDIEPLH